LVPFSAIKGSSAAAAAAAVSTEGKKEKQKCSLERGKSEIRRRKRKDTRHAWDYKYFCIQDKGRAKNIVLYCRFGLFLRVSFFFFCRRHRLQG
jgi:hypothetical protein